ncbi:MAG: hypothetical protein QXS68_06625 [Candidatus Methanomethylicaceae archaeon]
MDEPIGDTVDLEKPIEKWQTSVCPICGKTYYHSRWYVPSTCLQKECILEHRKRQQDSGDTATEEGGSQQT